MLGQVTDYSQPLDGAALRRRAASVLPATAARRGGFDELVVRGQGAYLWTAGGKRFVDYFLSHGTTVVGHGDPAVNDAAALAAGLPSAEKVAFVAGGGEALRQAVEVSRAATGRHRILTSDIGDGCPSRLTAALPGVTSP